MERSREDVDTSPSPFFSAVSPPREVDDLPQMPGICYGVQVDGRSAARSSPVLTSIWPSFVSCLPLLSESFSMTTTCSQTMG